jgi:L-ascorbate metabolism protein UlaG (beta-lactamase superfamily)
MQINYSGQFGFSLKGNSASVSLCADGRVGDENIVITVGEEAPKVSKGQIVFDWPGEYEAAGVSVMIIPIGKTDRARAVKLMLDDIAVAHLGEIAEPLTDAEEEQIGNVDILFVSIGKAAKLEAKKIQSAIEAIDPRLVIPMNFAAGEETDFAKLLGFAELEAVDSLKLKKADLPNDRMDLKILRPKK